MTNDDSSPLKMFLFIAMIVLGVFLVGSGGEGSNVEGVALPKRDLMAIKVENNG